MGTPHQGSGRVKFAEQVLNIASIAYTTDTVKLQNLRQHSQWLQQQQGQYNPISNDFVTAYAFESLPTQTLLGQSMMVSDIKTLNELC